MQSQSCGYTQSCFNRMPNPPIQSMATQFYPNLSGALGPEIDECDRLGGVGLPDALGAGGDFALTFAFPRPYGPGSFVRALAGVGLNFRYPNIYPESIHHGADYQFESHASSTHNPRHPSTPQTLDPRLRARFSLRSRMPIWHFFAAPKLGGLIAWEIFSFRLGAIPL